MSDITTPSNPTPTRRRRGKSKKGAMHHVSLRITMETYEYFRAHEDYTQKMREVLDDYARNALTPVGDPNAT